MPKSLPASFKLNGKAVSAKSLSSPIARCKKFLDNLPYLELVDSSQLQQGVELAEGTISRVVKIMPEYCSGGHGHGPLVFGNKRSIAELKKRLGE